MKIIVCVKQVPDTSVPVDIEQDGKNIVEDGLVYMVNPEDLCALEAAVRLKETAGGEVTVVTLGPPRAEEALRSCLAMGADRAVFLRDEAFAGGDSFATATVLAQAIGKMKYDLILTGSQTIGGGNGQAPAMVAELLGLPFVSGVTSLELAAGAGAGAADREITLLRKLERGDREIIQCSLPAVVGVAEGINSPRYASLPAVIEALRREIAIVKASDLGLRREQLGARGSLTRALGFTPPRPRPKKTFTPDSSLSPAERMRLLMSGGVSQKKSGDLLEGDPEKVADQVVQFLKAEKVVGETR